MSYLPDTEPLTLFCYGFSLLLLYSFLGWCGEMVYCSLGQGKLCEKRGFLNGLLCPIYGHGALIVLWALHGGCSNVLATFFWGGILTSMVEYITSFAMEKLFHMRWWDYSQKKFNIRGRVCLLNSTLFGIASVVLCHGIHPAIARWVGRFFQLKLAVPIVLVCLVLYLADIVLSVRSAIQIGARLEKLHAIHDELARKLEELKAESQLAFRELRDERLDALDALWSEGVEALDQRLLAAEAALEELKARSRQVREDAEARRTAAQEAAETRIAQGEKLLESQRDRTAAEASKRLEELSQLRAQLSRKVQLAQEDSEKRLQALYEGQDIFERRLLRAYPHLHSPRHDMALARLREFHAERRRRRHELKMRLREAKTKGNKKL